ncbi:hypothetical protein N7539_007692 [Penicillium diatomitis]|uniref:Uncharacterized protein n=1 Tax=Penicillium diatomitis TaxID=2819901 RepID=A0A9W9WLK4_9EURO|nr:uncharacterized protein N7539_009357 [Penicillium diatomitis]XP_056787158.1 uncharacterized protein N7539_007692 [Penicillium diatomitis]KAJ5469739.1 hypothetical protein N7539_009357 [Penicillium diatomitis]KAJ5475405.1 hypothetical protein N7539_007692 [Penicillium diatomitis]
MAKRRQRRSRDAREIQTPFSDNEDSVKPDNIVPKLLPKSDENQKTKKKTGKKTRFGRSPTRAGDFAPNAGVHDSADETDPDIMDLASDHGGMAEHEPSPVSERVKRIIREDTFAHSNKMIKFLATEEPDYENCERFFEHLNHKIHSANKDDGLPELSGSIPQSFYPSTYRNWRRKFEEGIETKSSEYVMMAFKKTHELINRFNERCHLPQEWNLDREVMKEEAEIKGLEIVNDNDSIADEKSTGLNDQSDVDEDTATSSQASSLDNNGPTGLDALESRTIKEQRKLSTAKVLYWWPKGTGSQTFVRYGDHKTPIYRIRAGSYERYNRHTVPRIFPSRARGSAKIISSKNGLEHEVWKYTREDVEDILGIGWKIEEDDEEGFDALDAIQATKDACYPQTRALVKWKDGAITLETRSFIRRISSGSKLDADRMIFQKAVELETAYRKKHGLSDDVDSNHSGQESDADQSKDKAYRDRSRRHSRFARRGSRDRSPESENTDATMSESEPSVIPQKKRPSRRRNESSERSNRRGRDEKEETATIIKLERQLHQLRTKLAKSGRS